MLCHLVACLWIICATFVDDKTWENTWVQDYHADGEIDSGLYMVSLYWTITTITTVGYGDISGKNNMERAYCSIVMMVGVVAYSFATGSVTSILANYDNTNAA
jgi:hypothetical protein